MALSRRIFVMSYLFYEIVELVHWMSGDRTGF